MDKLQNYNQIMETTTNLALASSVDGTPNVRIINFCYDSAEPNIIYFSTDRENPKNEEFAKNNRVSFTTIPSDGTIHARTNEAVVQKSDITVENFKKMMLCKNPNFEYVIKALGESLQFYEIRFDSVTVITGFDSGERLTF